MSNEGNIKASVFADTSKCIVVNYFDGSESFTGRLLSNYGPVNMLLHFFLISHLECFLRDSCQNVYEETILFLAQISKIQFKM